MNEVRLEGRPFSKRISRLLRAASRITGRGGHRSERVEWVLLVLALAIFGGATTAAWGRLPDPPHGAELGWSLLAVAFSVLTLWLNAAEFGLSGRLLGRRISPSEAVRVSVLGSAANVLPIPGAVLVRTRALRQAGEASMDALAVTTAVGFAWVGAASVLAGVVVLAYGRSLVLATVFLSCGVCTGLLALGLMRVSGRSLSARVATSLAAVEFASVVASGMRLYAVGRAVGFDVTVMEALTVNLGAILSHTIGVFPGGLGLREVVSGLFGGLVGIPVSVGVLMSVLDRIVLYPVLALAVVILTLIQRKRAPDAAIGGGRTDTS